MERFDWSTFFPVSPPNDGKVPVDRSLATQLFPRCTGIDKGLNGFRDINGCRLGIRASSYYDLRNWDC